MYPQIVQLLIFRKYKDTEYSIVFGYIQLDDASKASELEQTIKDHIEQHSFGDLHIIWGKNQFKILKKTDFEAFLGIIWKTKFIYIQCALGFALNMKSVEKDSVIHLSLQLWNEPWPYGMENEKTELR